MSQRRQGIIFFGAVLLTMVLITGLMRYFFQGSPPASFADLYLVAVVLLAYRCSWKMAAALAGVSLLLGAWLLLPLDRTDTFQLASYSICAALIIYIAAILERRRI